MLPEDLRNPFPQLSPERARFTRSLRFTLDPQTFSFEIEVFECDGTSGLTKGLTCVAKNNGESRFIFSVKTQNVLTEGRELNVLEVEKIIKMAVRAVNRFQFGEPTVAFLSKEDPLHQDGVEILGREVLEYFCSSK